MVILLGFITTLFLLLAMGRKIKGKTRVGKFLVRYHDYFAYIFLLVACVHMALSLKLLEMRYVTTYATGAAALLLGVALCVDCIKTKKNKENRSGFRVRHLVIALIVVAFTIAHIGVTMLSLKMYQKHVSEITFSNIDLRNVQNGVYRGEYDVGYIYAAVEVTVKDGKFTDIEIIDHETEKGEKAEMITEEMFATQSIEVDAISGATNSSLVIRKAVEEAIMKGCKRNNS